MAMREFSLVYVKPLSNPKMVLVILKNRPVCLSGRYNLPGGKLEAGETPEECALRELREETGIVAYSPKVVGRIIGGYGLIYCVHCVIDQVENPISGVGETEKVSWQRWDDFKHMNMVPNLKAVLPMMMCGIENFSVCDEVVDDKLANSYMVTVGN